MNELQNNVTKKRSYEEDVAKSTQYYGTCGRDIYIKFSKQLNEDFFRKLRGPLVEKIYAKFPEIESDKVKCVQKVVAKCFQKALHKNVKLEEFFIHNIFHLPKDGRLPNEAFRKFMKVSENLPKCALDENFSQACSNEMEELIKKLAGVKREQLSAKVKKDLLQQNIKKLKLLQISVSDYNKNLSSYQPCLKQLSNDLKCLESLSEENLSVKGKIPLLFFRYSFTLYTNNCLSKHNKY